jgi:carbonic anhydrase
MASHVRAGLVLMAATALVAGCGDDGDEEGEEQAPPAFSYGGSTGPDRWADLDPTYGECAEGRRQSPVGLETQPMGDVPKLEIGYVPATLETTNNGHSVEAEHPPGSTLELDGHGYELKQFHFHAPAEHRLDGQSAPLEFHLVHQDEDDAYAVLAVVAVEGGRNPAVARLVEALPAEEGETATTQGEVDPLDLLPGDPASATRWSYTGSLTTPPCTEPVSWTVFRQPIELSAEQIDSYTRIYDDTNRPLQPPNGRAVSFGT